MNTQILDWTDKEKAAAILRQGGIVCFPTETVFGMGAIASDENAFHALTELKKRPPEKPFTLMCANFTQAAQYAEIDVRSLAVMHAFMPGEITLLLHPRQNVPFWITLGSPFIGIRIPGDQNVREMIEKVGCPLLVPSANVSGAPTATSTEEVLASFLGKVDAVIQGKCLSKKASTIVICDQEKLTLVREGPIDFESIKKVYDLASFSISLASDHGGFGLKEKIKKHLSDCGISVFDFGTDSLQSCDYPLFAEKAAKAVAEGEVDLGIVVCTSGEGVMMVANKVKGVRCGIGYDDVVTGKCREHNNANMISFGAAYMKEEDVLRRVDIFLSEVFSPEEKHHRRVDEISNLEKSNNR